MRRFASFVVFALAASVSACSSAPSRTPCSTSAQCAAGQACVDAVCVVAPDAGTSMCGASCECSNDTTCQAVVPACVVAACVSGSCLYRTHDERCAFGQSCDLTAGCVGADGGPGADAAGGDGGLAIDAGGDAGLVLRDAGVVWRDAGGADAGTDGGGLSPLGGPCRTAANCAPINGVAAECLTSFPGSTTTFPGGYCTVSCRAFSTGACGAGGECVVASPVGTGACAAVCAAPTDCRTGYTCHRPALSSLASMTACLPPGI
jgi:hypothetical protein